MPAFNISAILEGNISFTITLIYWLSISRRTAVRGVLSFYNGQTQAKKSSHFFFEK
jgi:hypothetical protein